MQRFLIPSAVLLVVGSMGVTRVLHLEQNVDQLEHSRRQVPDRLRAIQSELETSQGRWSEAVAHLQAQVVELRKAKQEQEGVLASQLQEASASLEQERTRILQLERTLQDRQFDHRLEQVTQQFQGLSLSVDSALQLAESTRENLSQMTESLDPVEAEVHHRWRRIVGPTVQLAGDTSVGSGVVLKSTPRPAGEGYQTLVVTAWHVVRDILADKIDANDQSVPVTLYLEDGSTQSRTAHLVANNALLDSALLELDGTEPVENGATLASRSYLASRCIFHPVYAVGCPLGNDPIPTRGEISDLDHFIEGSTYWMISAPTYIGNSGGGIYDAQKNHLMGLFSKIYTHGNIRPTIVPHMGLVTPLALTYQWLEDEGVAKVVEDGDVATIVLCKH